MTTKKKASRKKAATKKCAGCAALRRSHAQDESRMAKRIADLARGLRSETMRANHLSDKNLALSRDLESARLRVAKIEDREAVNTVPKDAYARLSARLDEANAKHAEAEHRLRQSEFQRLDHEKQAKVDRDEIAALKRLLDAQAKNLVKYRTELDARPAPKVAAPFLSRLTARWMGVR